MPQMSSACERFDYADEGPSPVAGTCHKEAAFLCEVNLDHIHRNPGIPKILHLTGSAPSIVTRGRLGGWRADYGSGCRSPTLTEPSGVT